MKQTKGNINKKLYNWLSVYYLIKAYKIHYSCLHKLFEIMFRGGKESYDISIHISIYHAAAAGTGTANTKLDLSGDASGVTL